MITMYEDVENSMNEDSIKQSTSNPPLKSLHVKSCCGGEKLIRQRFKAGRTTCSALQPVFKQHPDSFLTEHENSSTEHADLPI